MSLACKDCKERKVGCHDTCEKYLDYRKKLDEENKRYRQERYIDFIARPVIKNGKRRCK